MGTGKMPVLQIKIENALVELIVAFVLKKFVELSASLHVIQEILLRSLGKNAHQSLLDRFHRQAKRGDRIDDHVVAERLKLIGAQELGFAELGHVRQQGQRNSFAELLEFAL